MIDAAAEAVAQISKNTLAVHGRKQEQNAICNIPAMARSHGVGALRDIFKGKPIVVAGAGPSLTKALPLLKEYAGKYCLIAVDRALKPLLDAGITPHVVTSTDMDVTVAPLFSGYRIPHSIALLYDRDGYYQLPKAWPGPLVTYDTFFDVPIWESTFLGFKGTLCKNFTVSHTAFYLAAQMGGSPIILTGIDFAYPDKGGTETHHVDGAVEIPNEVHEKKVAHWVTIPGNTLEAVHTTEVFSICVVAFESAIKESKKLVINTSDIGARMEGADYRPLDDILRVTAIRAPYQETLDAIWQSDKPSFSIEAFDVQSQHIFVSLCGLIEQCESGLTVLKRVKRLHEVATARQAEAMALNAELEQLTAHAPKPISGVVRDKALALHQKVTKLSNSIEMLNPELSNLGKRIGSVREEILSNIYLQYLLQRMMIRGTMMIEQLVAKMDALAPNDRQRIVHECDASTVMFSQQIECAKLFLNALYYVRKELGMDLEGYVPPEAGVNDAV